MNSLLNADDDWIEPLRLKIYPYIHKRLRQLGDKLGYNFYAIGHVGYNQYLGTVTEDEDVIEDEFESVGMVRNPIAALKSLSDERVSEGSWVLTHENDKYNLVEPGMQLHVTMFTHEDNQSGREIYAHYEDDWRTAARDHLNSANFSPELGVKKATTLIDNNTFLTLKELTRYH